MAAKMGRPSLFDYAYCAQARKLCELGATDRDVAEFFNVSEATVNRWKHEYPDFCDSLKVGKDQADNRVEQSLYRRAVGYSFDAVKIMQHQGAEVVIPYVEHTPPDVTACIFWLKNRRRNEWRDKVDHEHSGPDGGPIRTESTFDASQLSDGALQEFMRARRAKAE